MKLGDDPTLRPGEYKPFSEFLKEVQAWAEKVIRWQGTPDLWSAGGNWQSLTDSQYEEAANTLFSSGEQEIISAQLTAIKNSVKKTYDLTAAQEAKIDARFDEAEKAAKRLGRKDWLLLFTGGIFSLILADAITPDIAQHILMMTVHGLEHLFTSGPRSLRAE